MSSDDSDAPARFDSRFSSAFQRGSSSRAGTSRSEALAPGSRPRISAFVDQDSSATDALEAAFRGGPAPLDPGADRVHPDTDRVHPDDVPEHASAAVDESGALAFVRWCAIGCLALVVAMLAASVFAQQAVRTRSDGEWVFFLSQFVFIAAPGLFVLGIASLVFVGYRRRLTRPSPLDPSEGTHLR